MAGSFLAFEGQAKKGQKEPEHEKADASSRSYSRSFFSLWENWMPLRHVSNTTQIMEVEVNLDASLM